MKKVILVVTAGLMLSVVSCKEKTAAEKMEDKIENAAEKVEEKVENTTEKVEEAVEKHEHDND